jgi:hypothetical protein
LFYYPHSCRRQRPGNKQITLTKIYPSGSYGDFNIIGQSKMRFPLRLIISGH